MEQPELITLIEQCRAGDPNAQEKLVMETQSRVYYHCKKFLKNEEDAQDAAQDVLIAMITSLDKLREPAAFWGWVNSITARRCKFLPTRGTKEWQIPEDEDGNSMLDSIETLDDQTVPDKAINSAETQRLIMDIVDSLPPEQRMTVTFFYYDEMSVKAIAEIMKVSEGTVKSRLNYARKSIKDKVEQLEKKDGTKLYSVSLLPFLAYFLRRDAQLQVLAPSAAQALAQAALAEAGTTALETSAGVGAAASGAGTAAAGTSTGVGTATVGTSTGVATAASGATAGVGTATAGAAAGTGTATAGMAAAGAAGAKAGGVAFTKIIAAVLAGTLAVGGIGGGVYLITHQEEEPAEEAVSEPAPEEPPAPSEEAPEEPLPPEEEQEEPEEDYVNLYTQKVYELMDFGETPLYDLVYIDEDDVPELIASSDDDIWVNVYTVSDGALQIVREQWNAGRAGVPTYYPHMNAIREDYSTMAVDHMDTSHIFFRINEAFEPEEFFRQDGQFWGDGQHDEVDNASVEPEELRGLAPEPLRGTRTAEEILEMLEAGLEGASASGQAEPHLPVIGQVSLDFSPYAGTYAADSRMMESYSVAELTDLTLNSDGALSGGEATYSWSNAPLSSIQSEGKTPIRVLSGEESIGRPGSYTVMLYEGSFELEGDIHSEAEYYILYPAGVADDRGGESGADRVLYANLVGGAWEMLFTRTS